MRKGKGAISLKKGEARVKMTSNLVYSLSLTCAATLFDAGRHKSLRTEEECSNILQLYELLPKRSEMSHPTYGGLDFNRTHIVRMPPHLLFTLRDMLAIIAGGGWTQMRACSSRIDEIDALGTLVVLSSVSD